MLYELFYKYLILNSRASMPGIGTFGIEQVPATMDFKNKKLNPPTQVIRIESSDIATDTYMFYNYLSNELHINESEAARKFQDFTHEIQKQVQNHGLVLLPGIGKLKKNVGAIGYYLEPEVDTKQVLPDIWISKTQAADTGFLDVYTNAQPSLTQKTELGTDTIAKNVVTESKDYWWVFAIIFAIFSLAALLFYYI